LIISIPTEINYKHLWKMSKISRKAPKLKIGKKATRRLFKLSIKITLTPELDGLLPLLLNISN